MKTLWFALLSCLFFAGPSAQVSRAAETIIVGLSTGYPPYYYKENGEFTGICVDIVKKVAGIMGLEIQFREYPWKRLLTTAEKGQIDMIMPLYRTVKREKYLYFDNLEIARETNSFFVKRGSNIKFDGNFNTLREHKLGVIAEYSYGKNFDSYTGFNTVVTQNEQHLMDMFQHARFEVGIGNERVILYYAKQHNLADQLEFLKPHVTDDMLYLGFAKKRENGELHINFSAALQEFKQTKAYQDLLSSYGR